MFKLSNISNNRCLVPELLNDNVFNSFIDVFILYYLPLQSFINSNSDTRIGKNITRNEIFETE